MKCETCKQREKDERLETRLVKGMLTGVVLAIGAACAWSLILRMYANL